jgi:hypothetical protein
MARNRKEVTFHCNEQEHLHVTSLFPMRLPSAVSFRKWIEPPLLPLEERLKYGLLEYRLWHCVTESLQYEYQSLKL